MITIEQVPIERLFCSPANPRHNEEAVPHVLASIRRFGWQQPIVAKPSGEVIAGNTRLKAAQQLEVDTVPVVWFDGDDLEATAFAIADNRTHEFAEWDEPALAKLLDQLREEDALDGVGYSTEELDSLIAEVASAIAPTDLEDPGPGEPPDVPTSKTGDLWLLGKHRLLCGDSTNPDDVSRLMNGEQGNLLATDPPYGVDYTGANRPDSSGKDWSDRYREVEIEDFEDFLRSALGALLPHVVDEAGIYIWHAHRRYSEIDRVLDELSILRHQQIIWVKPSSTFTYSYYRWGHEPCVFGWRKGHKPPHYLENTVSSVWEADWEGKQRVVGNEHPTQKPVRLFEIPMEQHTRSGQIVVEPFCGSGSQLIAAEKLGRKCRAMELEPAFVDVAVRRWEKATGESAIHADTGQSFEELRSVRCGEAVS